jgi:D-alanyl-D-alanine carboxypeptidase (penicillin-binding protein 5/6)
MTLPTQKHRKKPIRLFILLAAVAVGVFFVWNKGQHAAEAHPTPPKPAYSVTPNWPATAKAAAVGVKGVGVLAQTGDTAPRPIASIAKVITALAILEKHPLKPGEAGPSIGITEHDEQLYRNYVAKNGTVVLVKNGIPISERDALEAMLLPSANNVADTTAIWAFGSLKKYHNYANDMLKRYGLQDTTVGVDASGLDPSTKSTASDLVGLGEIALNNPTIAEIVKLKAAYIPYAGDIPNYNAMVTKYGFTGLKPGESIQAKNTLLFSTDTVVNGKQQTIIGAVLGTEDYKTSNAAALQIVDFTKNTLKPNP